MSDQKNEKILTTRGVVTEALPSTLFRVQVEDKNTAIVFVPEDQLSLAIGKDGRNVRLAANLTGWKIDIKTSETPAEESEPEELDKSASRNLTGEAAASKPKKRAKKPVRRNAKALGEEKVGTDGQAVEEEPSEIDDAVEEKPAENPTEEK